MNAPECVCVHARVHGIHLLQTKVITRVAFYRGSVHACAIAISQTMNTRIMAKYNCECFYFSFFFLSFLLFSFRFRTPPTTSSLFLRSLNASLVNDYLVEIPEECKSGYTVREGEKERKKNKMLN